MRPLRSLAAIVASVAIGIVAPLVAAQPSEHQGRRGSYDVRDDKTGFHYRVYVPESYGKGALAGIHLYFGGDNPGKDAGEFKRWATHVLEPCTLIGISAAFGDANEVNSAAKAQAMRRAVEQVSADYEVVRRGMIASYSSGGRIHAIYWAQNAKRGGTTWPFTCSALYGSIYPAGITASEGCSWYLRLDKGEWHTAGDEIRHHALTRGGELARLAQKGGTPDIHLDISIGRGHWAGDDSIKAAAALFRRSDVAHGAFVYEPAYADPAVRKLAAQANDGAYGATHKAIAKALPKAEADAADQLRRLQGAVDARVDAVLGLCRALRGDGPLFLYYAKLFRPRLQGHPRAGELEDMLAEAARDQALARQLQGAERFWKELPTAFELAQPKLRAPEDIEEILALCGQGTHLGGMAAAFLKLR